jgi:hypothetical protein
MKPIDRTPSEIIDYIGELIRERENKNLPTFYTIGIEQYEKNTPVAEKEEGYDNFKKQVMKYMSDFNLTAITIQLFSGKSKNVKSPFQTFKVSLKKQNPTVVLGNTDYGMEKQTNDVQQFESAIPVGRYYDEKFELQMRIMRIEMEKQSLTERLIQLTERYEDKLKEQDTRNAEKIKLLEEEIVDLQQQIDDFEKEISKNEKDKHNSFGNIALGSISARAIESFAKSNMGTGLLKGLLGTSGYETLQGHLAGIENEKIQTPEKPSARIISEPDTNNPREVALNYIQKVGESLPDMYLRMLYDIVETAEKNIQDLQVVWSLMQQMKKQRGKTAEVKKENETPTTSETSENTTDEEEDTAEEDDLTKLS